MIKRPAEFSVIGTWMLRRRQDLETLKFLLQIASDQIFIVIITPIANLEMSIWNNKVLGMFKTKITMGEVLGRNLHFV